jgi:hypothetical protein
VKHRPIFKFVSSCFPLLTPQRPPAMARERFENVFSHIRSELIDHITAQGMPKEAIEWYAKVRAAPILQRPDVALSCAESRL